MMNIQMIKAMMNGLVSKYGEEEAIERFLEKHSEYEGEMYMVLNGEDELPETMKYTAPEDELPEVPDEEPVIVQETKVEVDVPVIAKTETKKETKVKKAKEIKEKKAKVVTEKAAKGPSKMDQAKAIYQNLEDKSRKNVCKVLMEQLDMTAAGSSTYAQLLKKWFESQQA